MSNTLGDLNQHLFKQLDRLGDNNMDSEKLSDEINRAKAITSVAQQIIANGSLVLEAKKVAENSLNIEKPIPKMLEG